MSIFPFSMFSILDFFFPFIFLAVFALVIYALFKGIREWNYNNHQPILTVDARIVAKRTYVSTNTSFDNNMPHMHHSDTSYYITFEVESGSRMEFKVPSFEYGVLAEGDYGKLTFQGTRYRGFKRV
ncbi:MAG: DUF2500 domain-containing protein [Clostridiales bacterium]|nr:DUF2500 domain-containing protein [Clostridiales bacterium]